MILSTALSCQSTPTTIENSVRSETLIENPELGLQLAKEGENDSPSFSPNGTQVVFISQNRKIHSQPQVYLVNLDTMEERRVTYQDGQCTKPTFSNDGIRIAYASNTDERKERPSLVNDPVDSDIWPASEIYEQNIDGTEITRLTTNPGYDGSPTSSEGNLLYFEKWNGKNIEIWKLEPVSKQATLHLTNPEKSIESFQHSVSEKKSAWIERDRENKTEVVFAKTPLKLPTGEYKNLSWWGSKLVFSTDAINQKFKIYSYDQKTDCMELMIEHTSDLKQPRMHPTRDALVFVSSVSGKNQIFYKSINVSTNPICVNKLTLQSQP